MEIDNIESELKSKRDELEKLNCELLALTKKQNDDISEIILKKRRDLNYSIMQKTSIVDQQCDQLHDLSEVSSKLEKKIIIENTLEFNLFSNLLKKYRLESLVTDGAIITGTHIEDHLNDNNKHNGFTRIGYSLIFYFGDVKLYKDDLYLGYDNSSEFEFRWHRNAAIRPIIYSKDLYDLAFANRRLDENGWLVGSLGEYFQTVTSKKIQKTLYSCLKNKTLKPSKKKYTLSDGELTEYEYIIDNKIHKYVLVKADLFEDSAILSNGVKINSGDYVWLEVLPVEWIIDTEYEMLISKYGLVSGIPDKDIIDFYNNHFLKEIFSDVNVKIQEKPMDVPSGDLNKILDLFFDELTAIEEKEWSKVRKDLRVDIKTMEIMMRMDGLIKKRNLDNKK